MSDYEEDAERIERDYVDADSVTEEEIRRDLRDAGFAPDSIDDVSGWMGDLDDVSIDRESAHSDGITTREDVSRTVDRDLDASDKTAETRRDAIEDAVARDIGAPRESDLRREQTRSLTQNTGTPGELLDDPSDTRTTPVSLVEDSRGNTVASIGGGAGGREVADELGVRHYSSPEAATRDMGSAPSPDGSRAALTLGDDVVGEVEIR